MTNRRKTALLTIAALLCIAALNAVAQGKKNKVVAPKAVTKTSDPNDSTVALPQLAEYDSTRYRYFLFPQFYTYWPIENRDTVLKYEAFDRDGNFMNMDTVYDISQVQHIYLLKVYLDYTQTMIDAEGQPKPQPIGKRLYQYDRTGADSWSSRDLVYQESSTLTEHKKEIVKTDTTIVVDRVNGTRQVTIRKYYKVVEPDKDNVTKEAPVRIPSMDAQAATPGASATHFVTIFYVPEFYFPEPKVNKDTVLKFLCYDHRDSLMNNITNYDSVRYYSLFKSYTDSAHTYKDKNGEKQLLPVSSIIKRYDHLAENKWMSIEYPKNKYQELTAYKDIIVSNDTLTMEDPVDGSTIQKVYKYYKVGK